MCVSDSYNVEARESNPVAPQYSWWPRQVGMYDVCACKGMRYNMRGITYTHAWYILCVYAAVLYYAYMHTCTRYTAHRFTRTRAQIPFSMGIFFI